jgi:hypothetical protein
MGTVVDEVEETASRPHVALERILLIFKLFGRSIDGRTFIEGEVVHFGNLGMVDASSTAEICYFYDDSFRD